MGACGAGNLFFFLFVVHPHASLSDEKHLFFFPFPEDHEV